MPPTLKKHKKSPATKRVVRSQRIMRSINNQEWIFPLRTWLPGASNFTSSGVGILSQVIRVNDPSGNPDWSSLANLFDNYKVLNFKATYIPCGNMSEATGTALAVAYQPLFVSYDPDSSSQVTTIADSISYDNSKIFDLTRKWSYHIPNPKTVGSNSTNNAGNSLVDDPKYGQMMLTTQPAYYDKGILQWYASTGQVGVTFGNLYADYLVVFKNRK